MSSDTNGHAHAQDQTDLQAPQSPQQTQPPITVAVCVPHGRDATPIYFNQSYQQELLRTLTILNGREVHCTPFGIVGDEYARARNGTMDMVQAFEAEHSMRFDYILWVDDDIVLPAGFLHKLLQHNLPIVSGLYIMRRPPYLPVAYYESKDPATKGRFWNVDSYPPDALIEVDAVGQGCVLIQRQVYEALHKPYYAWQSLDWQAGDEERGDYNTLGEDMYFFGKAKRAGFRVFLDTGVKCGHVGSFIYNESMFLANQLIYRRTPSTGKLSILFLPSQAPKPWDYNTMKIEGLGGSESAVAYLAHNLANRHHHTVYVVSGSAPNHIEGVNYRPYSALSTLMSQPWDVVVVSRWADVLQQLSVRDAVKLLVFWAHDMMQFPVIRHVYKWSNVFVTLTPFHARNTFAPWPENTPDLTEMILPNGVDLQLFSGSEERVPGRMLWTSNPNRGLPTAIRIFREARKRHPELELHVYGRAAVYGWGRDSERSWLPQIDEPGVYVHDPLPKPQLARELMKAWMWFYPTHWPETSSIAALEAQAAGTPVLTNPYAGLVDTVDGGILTYDFLGAIDDFYDGPSWELMSLRGKAKAAGLDWGLISDRWDRMFAEEILKG